MKRLLLAAAAATASLLALGGCKNPCLELAQQICDCQTTSSARDLCNQQVSDQNGRVSTTSEDEDLCSALKDQCDCHTLDTAEGKLRCGLARPPVSDAGTQP